MTRLATAVSAAALLTLAGAAQAQYWVPMATTSGGVAVYYNGPGNETPANVSYYRAQFNNSTTLLNGAALSFLPAYSGIFGDVGQHGLDLIVAAPTNTGSVPTLTAYDNTDNNISGRAAAGNVAWAINNYYDSLQSPPPGPGNPAQSVVNSTIRGNGVTFSVNSLAPLFDVNSNLIGFTAAVSGTLTDDGLVHWYNPGFTDSPWSNYPLPNGDYMSGEYRFSGSLTYLIGDDTTDGMDFYTGSVLIEAQFVPAPGAAAVLGLGAAAGLRRRRR